MASLTSEIVIITPDTAEEWLRLNVKNRPLKYPKIEQFSRDMAAGNWRLTGESIKFGTDGSLLDGQNRLHAAIKAGVSFTSLVNYNVEPAAQDVMDSGTARTSADALTMRGHTDAKRIAAAARVALCMEHNVTTKVGRFTTSEVSAWVEANPDIADTGVITGPHWRLTPTAPSVTTYSAWRLGRIDSAAAREFFAGVIDGFELPPGSAIAAYRRRMSGNYGTVRKISLDEQLALTFRTWNAFRADEAIERLVMPTRTGKLNIPTPI